MIAQLISLALNIAVQYHAGIDVVRIVLHVWKLVQPAMLDADTVYFS